LEHVANPLRALEEWRRVLENNGLLLLILPHKDGTFDWRRPVTELEHMIDDYEKNVGEEDLTHLPEILALHDLKKDLPAGSAENFRLRCAENSANRAMHHHVFDTSLTLRLLDRAHFQLLRVSAFAPCHIIVLSRKCDGVPDNMAFLAPDARYRNHSPFSSDRTRS
jgi:SAM-dependent methyltransferase